MCVTTTDIYPSCCGHHDTFTQRCASKISGGICLTSPGQPPRHVVRWMEKTFCSKCIRIRTDQPKSIPEEALVPYYGLPTQPRQESLAVRMSTVLGDAAREVKDVARTTRWVAKMAFRGPIEAVRSLDGMFGHDGVPKVAVQELDFSGRHSYGQRRPVRKSFVDRKIVPFLDKIRE